MARILHAGSGHNVTVTAAFAEQPMAVVPAAFTAVTKGGLDAVTPALAIEYAGRGIRVNAASPDVTGTPMHPFEAHGLLAILQPSCWSSDARFPSVAPDHKRGGGNCAQIPDPCNTTTSVITSAKYTAGALSFVY